ncbi:unnamed protein product [Rotaria sordida]|uniref:ADP-ribosylglycohydrolase n=1 Tax=Rotaria sordida TaxID=392033 RepID=A0A815XLU7_9BILA|nr:unnamed protein product [Rotaria sordida]CAF1559402.1 unnamed protein product [Rotaria sordida]
MINTYTRCEGAFIGHAVASKYDPSILMALNISQSLVEYQKFDGSDILSRYLYLYHTKKCEIGEITKYIYQETLKRSDTQSLISRENFRFDQSVIDEIVKLADTKFEGRTAGCGPAQRSYPLAFCQYIKDDDLFDCTLLEAKLTHNNPIAGQVAGIVNLICRSLINNNDWNDAVNSALATPRLHNDIMEMAFHRNRRFYHDLGTPAAYAPTALNSALYCVSVSDNAAQAIANAYDKDKSYCAPIVGILAGARWGIPLETYKDNINDLQLAPLRDIASKLSTIWKSKNDGPHY